MTKAELAADVGNSKEGKNSNVEHIANSKKVKKYQMGFLPATFVSAGIGWGGRTVLTNK
jgi:hypothetical protein